MAIFGKSTEFLTLLDSNLISNSNKRNTLTLAGYLNSPTSKAFPGVAMVQYLISNGVAETTTITQLIGSAQYFNLIGDSIKLVNSVNNNNTLQDIVGSFGQDSGVDVDQHALSVEPQNQYMSYKPSNKSLGDYYGYIGSPSDSPLSYTDENGNNHIFELYYVQTVLGDGTLIFEAWDTVDGYYWWVAMRRSSHNFNNLEFVDAIPYTTQFDNEGYDYTVKNGLNSMTFHEMYWSTFNSLETYSTTLTINSKGKLIATDNYRLINGNGLLAVYNELTGNNYTDIQYNWEYPWVTMNDDFNELMSGSKTGTYYFLVYQYYDGGWNGVDEYQNIMAVNFLTGTYELINAVSKLQEVVDAGNFPNDWGNPISSNPLWQYQSHPEGLLFTLNDDFGTNNDATLDGVTRLWSAEWSNYLNPVPLTSRYLDNYHWGNNGTYNSTSGYIFDQDSDWWWNMSPKNFFIYFNTTQSAYYDIYDGVQKSGPVENQIYRFELNPKSINTEPELQTIPRYTPDFRKKITTSNYERSNGGDPITRSGYYQSDNVEYAEQFPTNNGMLISYSNYTTQSGYWSSRNPFGELNINYWADNSNKPVALGSNLGAVTNHTNDSLMYTYSNYYTDSLVWGVNVDKYKGQNFGI